jgi:hypothetical protein
MMQSSNFLISKFKLPLLPTLGLLVVLKQKNLKDILPEIINQLGPDNLENLKELAEKFRLLRQ